MAEVIIDLSNYKDRFGGYVSPGRYRVRVADTDVDKSAKGNDMIIVYLDIIDGEYAGTTLVDRLTLVERAMFRVVGFMAAIGLQTPRKRLRINTQQWVGRVLDIDVEDGEPYNGRVRSEIRGYLRVAKATAPANGAAPADDLSALEDFAAPAVEPASQSEALDDLTPQDGPGDYNAAQDVPARPQLAKAVQPETPPAPAVVQDDLSDLEDLDSLEL